MKTAKQMISLMMAMVMLFTCTPILNATDWSNTQAAALREKIAEGMMEASRAQDADHPYGVSFPTLKQMGEKMARGAKRAEENSSLIEEELSKKLSPAEEKEVEKATKKLEEETDKYLVEHKEDFDKYAKGIAKDKKKQMATSAILLSISVRDIRGYLVGAGVTGIQVGGGLFYVADKFAEKLSAVAVRRLQNIAAGIISASLISLLIELGFVLASSDTTYFSPKAVGLDCGGFFDKRPCRARHPEQVKKEFLADPFGAVEFFATHNTGEMKLVYLAGPEGASMLNDTVDIMENLRRFDMQDEFYKKQMQKMLYTKTLDWQKLSQKEKVAYLHQFAQEAKRDRFKF